MLIYFFVIMLLKNSLLFVSVFFLINIHVCGQQKTENVILITLDGLRWQELFQGADPDIIGRKKDVDDVKETRARFWDNDPKVRRSMLFPFIWSTIAVEGQIYGNRELGNKVNVINRYWFSYPGYNELLTGASDKRIRSNARIRNPNQTILEFVNKQNDFKDKVAAFASWDVFHYIINSRAGIHINAGNDTVRSQRLSQREAYLNHLQQSSPSPWKATRFDKFTHQYALDYLKKNSPKLMLIAYGETDEFAHMGKYDAYLESARNTDEFIREIWNYVQTDETYRDKTTLIITTDHGRGAGKRSWKSHGIGRSGSNHTWIMVLGPDSQALGEVKDKQIYYNSQLARTIAAFLNLNFRDSSTAGDAIATALAR